MRKTSISKLSKLPTKATMDQRGGRMFTLRSGDIPPRSSGAMMLFRRSRPSSDRGITLTRSWRGRLGQSQQTIWRERRLGTPELVCGPLHFCIISIDTFHSLFTIYRNFSYTVSHTSLTCIVTITLIFTVFQSLPGPVMISFDPICTVL